MNHETAAPGAATGGFGRFAHEVAAGMSHAFVLVAALLALGFIAFAPLGSIAAEAGFRAAFAAAIFGNLTLLVLGGAVLPNEIPRASSVFLFAAFVARIAGDPLLRASPSNGVGEILFLAAVCIALTAILQITFGFLQLGNIARFVPYPVVAGLMTGLAFSLVYYELPEILGTHGEGGHHGVNPWTVTVAVATILTIVALTRRFPAWPAKLVGIAVGTAVAVAITTLSPEADVGPRVPFLGKIPAPDALAMLFSKAGLELAWTYRYDLIVTALAIAVVGSLDSLLAAVGETVGPLDTAHHPNRLLVALGCGNLVSASFGGVPVAYSSHEALSQHKGAPRAWVSSITTTLTLVVMLLYAGPVLHLIPIAALSGVMLVLAVGFIDRWAGSTLARLRRGHYDNELLVNILLVVVVAGVTVAFGLIPGVITGLILSMGLFVAVMNRSLIRSIRTGVTNGSRRVYPPEQAAFLRIEGNRIKIIEVDGAIFFGTADRLAFETMRAAEGATFLILDLRRVTMIDASGALMLDRVTRRLREQGTRLLVAHISATGKLGRSIHAAGVFTGRELPDWFDDADQALEWAEQQLLKEARFAATERELAIGEFALMEGLSPEELAFMKPYLDRQLFPARAALYHEGQLGDRLYLLARGAVSIVSEDPDDHTRNRRVVTLAPGVIFGESAMIEGGVRSVTAIAEGEVVTYSLSRRNLDAIRTVNADLYRRLVLNMLSHLSGLMRMASSLSSDGGDTMR
jgi:SulP family sulfate permease